MFLLKGKASYFLTVFIVILYVNIYIYIFFFFFFAKDLDIT